MSRTKNTAQHQSASTAKARLNPKNRKAEVSAGASRPQPNPAVKGSFDGDVSDNMPGAAK